MALCVFYEASNFSVLYYINVLSYAHIIIDFMLTSDKSGCIQVLMAVYNVNGLASVWTAYEKY